MEFSQFQKQPWYEKSSTIPPSLPYSLEMAFLKVYSSIMHPSNWYHYQSNLDTELKRAISISRSLPTSGIGVYCQDKSSRICFASLEKTNQKVEQVLSDETKYKKVDVDMAVPYQDKIKAWYTRSKPFLKSIPDDISKFLVPEQVSTPHLKVMIKTHKPNCPVRLTFSSIGSATSHLSTSLSCLPEACNICWSLLKKAWRH